MLIEVIFGILDKVTFFLKKKKGKKHICATFLFSFNRYAMNAFQVPGTMLESGIEE